MNSNRISKKSATPSNDEIYESWALKGKTCKPKAQETYSTKSYPTKSEQKTP
jgi:hypothetical protein